MKLEAGQEAEMGVSVQIVVFWDVTSWWTLMVGWIMLLSSSWLSLVY